MCNLLLYYQRKACAMRRLLKSFVVIISASFFCLATPAQSFVTISGNVRNAVTKEPVAAVSVMVKGSGAGTFTDDRGNLNL